jgi:hypothetical protein
MVLHWLRLRGPGWQLKMVINGVGALATGITLLVVGFSKFLQGAWITIVVIPLLCCSSSRSGPTTARSPGSSR